MKAVGHKSSETAGTRWLGEVPSHWKFTRLKNVADYWVSNVDKVPAEGEEPVRLCNYTDVYYNEHLRPDLGLMQTTATAAEIRRFHLQVGDVVITKDSEEWSDIAVPALVTDTAPDLVCGYHLAIVRPRPNRLYGPFLQRLFQSAGVNTQLQVSASGITRYSLPKNAIGEAVIPLPPLDEQRAISNFLDRETALLETLLASKARLRQLAAARLQSLVRSAVRIGLNRDVELVPTSIEWLGSAPKNWKFKKLGHIARIVRGASPRPAGSPEFFNGDAAPWITVAEITKDSSKFLTETTARLTLEGQNRSRLIPTGTVVLTNSGATLGVPKILALSGCINDGSVAFLGLSRQILPDYLFYYLSSLTDNYRERIKQGSGQPNLNTTIVKATPFLAPPLAEQHQIVDYLDALSGATEKLTFTIDAAAIEVKELRSSLISAAVTGEIDVRTYRPQEAAALCQ